MAVVAPQSLVEGAPRNPLPYGLFSALAPREGAEQDRWENGVQWEQITLDQLGGLGQADKVSEDTLGMPKQLGRNRGEMSSASAFTVYGHFNCSPVGYSPAEAQELANAHLALREEARVEQALWTGDLGNVPNFAGAHDFGAPVEVGSGTLDKVGEVFGLLESWIAQTYGSQGVIHLSRLNASRASSKLENRGGKLFTKMGTPVISGTGYGDDKIVVTPALFAYRSAPFTSSNVAGDLFNRDANELTAIAERTYLVGFDKGALGAYTLTTPAP